MVGFYHLNHTIKQKYIISFDKYMPSFNPKFGEYVLNIKKSKFKTYDSQIGAKI